jgi:glycosyltransferase involved in cell wall biosynthesis
MPTLCLNMIVKNEAHVLARCLASVKPWIDSWVIVDTGSSDGTQALIREQLQGLPGQLYERPWQDFASNRSEALALARPWASHLLFIDADETLVAQPGTARPELSADLYDLEMRFNGLSYLRPSLAATHLDWRYQGVLHEFLCLPEGVTWRSRMTLQGFHVEVRPEGARSRDPEKFQKDAQVLEAALAREPGNARYAYYLAQSYRDAGALESSLAAYRRRVELPGWDEETWHARYQIARILELLGRPEPEVVHAYLAAYEARPSRIEPLGWLARYLRLQGRFHQALIFASRALELPPCGDLLFQEPEQRGWRCLDEFAVSAYWAGRHRESLAACDRLLTEGQLPGPERDRVEQNRAFALQALATT